MREGFLFSLSILFVAAIILGSLIWSVYFRDQQDTQTKAELAKMCIERQGLWIDQSKNCIIQPGTKSVGQ